MAKVLIRDAVIRKGTGKPPDDAADFWFLNEISLQCQFALASFGEIQSRIANGSNDDSMLAFAHMLLSFGASATKVLFPATNANNTAKNRASRLRNKLGLPNVAPAQLVDARNYFEHFDERMDRFLFGHGGLLIHRLISAEIANEVEVSPGVILRPKYLQFLNTSTIELTLYDQVINLKELAENISAIHVSVTKTLNEIIDAATKGTSR